MVDITSGHIYADLYPKDFPCGDVQGVFCFDQQKRNLLALLGDFTFSEIDDLPLALDINEFMDGQTREHLRKLPLDFMRYWESIDDGSTGMLQRVPYGYMSTMRTRAATIQRRILAVDQVENVTYVNFRRSA